MISFMDWRRVSPQLLGIPFIAGKNPGGRCSLLTLQIVQHTNQQAHQKDLFIGGKPSDGLGIHFSRELLHDWFEGSTVPGQKDALYAFSVGSGLRSTSPARNMRCSGSPSILAMLGCFRQNCHFLLLT